MTADVSILVADRDSVLQVPNAALRYTPPDGVVFEQTPPAKLERSQQLVYAVSSGGAKLRPIVIKTGITDGTRTEVVQGLTEGEALVTSTLSTAPTGGGFGSPPPQMP